MSRTLIFGLVCVTLSAVVDAEDSHDVAHSGEPPTIARESAENVSENEAANDGTVALKPFAADRVTLKHGANFSMEEYEKWSGEMRSHGVDLGHAATATRVAFDVTGLDPSRRPIEPVGDLPGRRAASDVETSTAALTTRLDALADRTSTVIERAEKAVAEQERRLELTLPYLFGMTVGGFGFLGVSCGFFLFNTYFSQGSRNVFNGPRKRA